MEAVLVAVITAVGAVLAAMITSMRKENHEDHAVVTRSLDRIESKIDEHIGDHAKGEFD